MNKHFDRKNDKENDLISKNHDLENNEDFKLFKELKKNLESEIPLESVIPDGYNYEINGDDQPTGRCTVCGEFTWIYVKTSNNLTFLCQKHYSDKMEEYLKDPELNPLDLLTEELHLRDIPLNYAREFFGAVTDIEYLLSKLESYLYSKMKAINKEIKSMQTAETYETSDPHFKSLQLKAYEDYRFKYYLTLSLKKLI